MEHHTEVFVGLDVAKTRHAVAVAEGGSLDVSCHADGGDVVMVWAERGGPPVVAPTGPPGFGSRLVAQNISGQLGGSIAFDWPTEGVVATLRMSKTRLAT